MGKSNPPPRLPNRERRCREYLTGAEMAALIKAARHAGRHGHRDATLILIGYRHGLRVGELVALRWDQVDLSQGLLHVNRLKNGHPGTHPLRGPELRALRMQRAYPDTPYVFISERQAPLTTARGCRQLHEPTDGFATGTIPITLAADLEFDSLE